MVRHGTANGGVPAPGAHPRFQESKCHACCKTPFGCGRNFLCACHVVEGEKQ